MKVLVTGAGGFLGSHIVEEALSRQHEVHAIVRKTSRTRFLDSLGTRVHRHVGDLSDIDAVRRACAGIDLIIHSAGRVTDHGPYEAFVRDNVRATENLLAAARSEGVKAFVFVSSPSIFAGDEDHCDADESLPYPAVYANFYAETKSLAEQKVLAANDSTLFTCSLRPRGIWGERDTSGFFPKLLAAMKKGKLKDFSRGKAVRASVCHAKNIAEACFQAAEHRERTAGQAYFIADAETVLVWELIRKVGAAYGLAPIGASPHPLVLDTAVAVIEGIWRLPYLRDRYSPPLSRYSLGMLTQHTSYSIAKARRDFGYDPKYSMSRNLDGFMRWIEEEGGLDRYLGLS